MGDIRVQTYAEKIVNKGGGIRSGSRLDLHEVDEVSGKFRLVRMVTGENGEAKDMALVKTRTEVKQLGSDYVVFNCAKCSQRNKRCVHDAKPIEGHDGNALEFRCHKCYTINEVKRPLNLSIEAILTPKLFDKDGNPL